MAFASLCVPIRDNPEVSQEISPLTFFSVDYPYSEPPSADAYFGLLTDPEGLYGKTAYGSTTAFTLRGSPLFISRAYNLFASFGGESFKPEKGDRDMRTGTREPVLRKGDEPNSAFFCMPPYRVKMALRLYLYCQLYKHKALVQVVLDKDGELIDTICVNEKDLSYEAMRLAESFYYYEIHTDHRTIGSLTFSSSDQPILEHAVREPESFSD